MQMKTMSLSIAGLLLLAATTYSQFPANATNRRFEGTPQQVADTIRRWTPSGKLDGYDSQTQNVLLHAQALVDVVLLPEPKNKKATAHVRIEPGRVIVEIQTK